MSQIDRLGLLRYSERLLIVIGGGPFFAYLGYRLFTQGITTGEGRFEGTAAWVAFTLSGTGPGLFFMAFGAVLLTVGLLTGRIRYQVDESETTRHREEVHFLSLLRRHPRVLTEGLKAEYIQIQNCDSASRRQGPQNTMLARSFSIACEELEEIERMAEIDSSDGYAELVRVKEALKSEATEISSRRQPDVTAHEGRRRESIALGSAPPQGSA